MPAADASFDHVFANCSLEHMDNLDAVLAEIHRCLKLGGTLLCCVVLDYYHLANPLSVDEWAKIFNRAGLVPDQHVPILPKPYPAEAQQRHIFADG